MASPTKNFTAINLASRLTAHKAPWNPECLFTVNDHSYSFRLVKIHGSFVWHSHSNTDETFFVVNGGPIQIELNATAACPEEAEKEGATDVVKIAQGEIFCVPRGMQHRPVADVEAGVMVVEKTGTANVGERTGNEMRWEIDESGR